MPRKYEAKQGDCILSIATREGFFWKTIWDYGENRALKQKRGDPNLLLPGDVVTIPDKTPKEESAATEQTLRFVRKGIPAKFRLFVEKGDMAVKDADYILTVDGKTMQGRTDGRGFIEVPISPEARSARLEVDGLTYELEFGAMDPLDETVGVQARLQNLGFYDGPLDGTMRPNVRSAIAEFQAFSGLEATGELDQDTLQKLHQRHEKDHEQAESVQDTSAPPAEEPPGEEHGSETDDSVVEEEETDAVADSGTGGTEEKIEVPDNASDASRGG